MAKVNRISKCTIHSVSPPQSSVQRRGNGRRLAAVLGRNPDADIPEAVDAADHADYEVHCSWTEDIYSPSPTYSHLPRITSCDLTDQDSMIFLGNGEGTGRPTHSKIILTKRAETAYAVLTWADLFGYAIKESQLGRKGPGGGNSYAGWILYTKVLRDDQLSELRSALYEAGISY